MENKEIDEVLEAKKQSVGKQISDILKDNKMGLFPYIKYTDQGIIPMVTLVETNDEDNDKDKPDTV